MFIWHLRGLEFLKQHGKNHCRQPQLYDTSHIPRQKPSLALVATLKSGAAEQPPLPIPINPQAMRIPYTACAAPNVEAAHRD
jgi:hypothetical protein